MTPSRPSEPDWNEDTRPDVVSPLRSSRASGHMLESDPPLSEDQDVYARLGQVMAAVARTNKGLADLKVSVGLLEREASQLRKDLEKDREELVRGASKRAATHSSNRLAGLMAGLFALWEVASPYVHELLKVIHQ